MDLFFYESIAKEKIGNLREEGTRNQAFHRSCTPKPRLLPGWPKLIIGVLGILGILALLGR